MTKLIAQHLPIRQVSQLALVVILSSVYWIALRGADEPSKAALAPPQAYLLPLDVAKIESTAMTELLKLRPELKAEDLKVNQLMYILTPDPDYAIQMRKDGTEEKIFLSSNYQQLSVSYIILHTKHDGEEKGRHTIIHDTISVDFPNARTKNFSVSLGTNTEFH